MTDLLNRSLEQTSATSREELFGSLLEQLVPDEARILAALSDGSAATVINVLARQRTGGAGETLLAHASLVGRTANLTLPHLTPTYVTHLIALGLVTTGPEAPELKAEYEILSADDAVRAALTKGAQGPIPGVIERRTLVLTPLGTELWTACADVADGA
jgi:hypothetical protein